MKPPGELDRIDLEALIESDDFDEDNFNIGIDTIGDFTWKQRLDLDACVSCGRCEEVCPAVMVDQPLSPKKFIAAMKDLTIKAEANGNRSEPVPAIVGNAFDQEFIWYCLTCMACTQACPAFIAHVDTLVEIRRNEVGMKGRADDDAARLIRAMEVQGNPFGSQIKRDEWVKSLDIPLLNEGDGCDVLYWIGCLTTFDEDKQKIASDLVRLLKKGGIDLRVLGKAEYCCGDPARSCGAENLFQETVKSQVKALNSRVFKRLLVSCPHCYNSFKNEYPQFGGRFQVIHHSELLCDMLRDGKLLQEKGSGPIISYHDPCYLGRYQQIFDAPRQILNTLPNTNLEEMESCRENSLCCGGGGGHFWMDPKGSERINVLRVQQAERLKANTIVTACPYCFHMLQDALKIRNLEKQITVKDISGFLY